MLQMVSTKVAGAWEALAALKKHGREAGNGRLGFLGRGECNSFSYNQSGFTIDGNRLHLSKIGMIKIKLHRLPAQIKQVTIMKKNERWYAIVTCGTLRRTCSVLSAIKPIGIDVGITHFAYDSDGNSTKNPLFLKEMQEPLKRAQRKVSRKRKGSNNRKKAKSRLASSWRTFKTMLDYKANRVVEVEPWNTSILCSKCGSKVPKSLAMRTHQCGKCQLAIDRDYNASLNILQRGRILLNLPAERREVTPAEIAPLPTTVGGQVQSLKQEAHTVKHVQFTGNRMRL